MVLLRIGSEQVELDWDEWERRVRDGRIPPDALVRFEPITGMGYRAAADLEMYRSIAASGSVAVERAQARSGPPLLTALLVGVQARIFFLAQVPPVGGFVAEHLTKWAPPTLEDGEVWRPITMGFVHTSLQHALMNLLWLVYTSWNLERVLGWRSLLVLYVTSVTGGSLLSMAMAPAQPSLGASGGIFGLVAAIVVFGFTRPELLPERSRRVFGYALLPYMLLMLASGAMNSGTDNFAHLGGLLTGGALALLADPPGLERRPRWNARWQGVVALVVATILAGLYALGPRIEALDTPEQLRADALARTSPDAPPPSPPAPDSPRWLAPVGWTQATTVTGDPGWTSPLAHRAWSVAASVDGAPVTVEQLHERLVARLQREGWTPELGAPEPTTVAGLPGVVVTGLLRAGVGGRDDRGDLALTWRASVRGLHALQTVWQVEPAKAERLAPLQARLEASVSWPQPAELTEAEALVAGDPRRLDARRQLGTALASVGRVDEALAVQRALISEAPTSRRDRLALLRTLSWYPTAVPDLDAVLDEALAADLGPQVTAAVADVLDSAHRSTAARGLLELAAARAPGERTIARARAARGISNTLHPTLSIPLTTWWDLAHDRPRTPAERDALVDAPLTVRAAEPVGAAIETGRDHLARRVGAQLDAGSADLVGTLSLLALGHPAIDGKTAWDDVKHGVQVADEGDPPSWWHPELPAPERLRPVLDPLPDEAALPRIPTIR